MKNLKKAILAFIVIGIIGAILVVAGCGKSSSSTSATTQTSTYTVQKGNLTSTVSAVGSVQMPEQGKLTFGTGSSTSSLYTVNAINVSFGDEVKKGDVLATIDNSALKTAITEAQSNLSTARINLEDAQNPYSAADLAQYVATLENAQASLAAAELALSQAQAAAISDLATTQVKLDNAQRNLTIVKNSTNITITNAENSLSDAQKIYDNYVWNNILTVKWAPTADIIAQRDRLLSNVQTSQTNLDNAKLQADSNIADAQATLQSAQANVETTKANDAINIQQKQAQLNSAKAALMKAQENLDKAKTPDSNAIELAQIKVDNAQSALDNDNAQLEATTIVAPYDGVIAAVYYDVGAKVSATNEIIYLVNTSKVEISSSVDETDVAVVKAGQTSIVTFDAIENASLKGTVGAISPVASSSSNVVTYSFTIKIDNTKGYDLKEGMSASAEIFVLNKTGVLLVPTTAISRSGRDSVVQVVTGSGTNEPRTIQTGDTNGTQTEVISGLSEGETILVKTSTTSSTTSSNRTPTGSRGFFIDGGGGGPSFQVGP